MSLFTKSNHYADKPYYPSEPAELDMRNWRVFPAMRVWKDSLKYIFSTVCGKIFPWCRVSDKMVRKVQRDLAAHINAACQTKQEHRDFMQGTKKIWPDLARMLRNNRGLVKFMNDGGSNSLSFAIFPAKLVPRAIALESEWGANYTNAGKFARLLPIDVSRRSAAVEPTFVFLRERTHEAYEEIMAAFPELEKYRNEPAKEKLGCIVDLGAGLLAEFRKFGITLAQIKSLRIVACDMDTTLRKELDVVFMHDFGVPFAETGIEYRTCSIEEVLVDSELLGGARIVLMDGVASYLKEETLQDYVSGMKKLLAPGGVIRCDLQVMEVSLIRCAKVQGWESAMKPEWTAGCAIKKMQRVARKAGLELLSKVDSRNPRPVGVCFRMWNSTK